MKIGYVAIWIGLASALSASGQVRDEGWRLVLGPSARAEVRGGADAARAVGDAESLWVRRGEAAGDVSSVLLQYDLTDLPLSNTAHAVIYYRGDAEGEGLNPSMAVYGVDPNWASDSVTMNTLPRKRERIFVTTIRDDTAWAVAFFVTDYVRKHFHEGRISFLIEMRSAPGFSKAMRFSEQPWLALAKDQTPLFDFKEIMQPVWEGDRVYNETLLPTSTDGAMARANLAFEPEHVVRVMDYGLKMTYEEGKDYVMEGRTLLLTPDSSIPFLRYDELYSAEEIPGSETLKTLDGGHLLLDAKLINDRQLCVTYDRREPWRGPVPSATDLLPRTLAKLERGESIKVVLFGDSICVGGDSSAKNDRAPYMPIWSTLAAKQLRNHYRSDVDWINPSLGGTISRWGVETVEGLAAFEKPDLAIISFGMNDGAWMSVDEFMANNQRMMDAFRAQNPDVEFILIESVLPNPRWRDLTLMEAYREAALALQGPGLAVADVWGIHAYLLERKTYWDITSNHVNHPNDFMARVYAQVISALLGANN